MPHTRKFSQSKGRIIVKKKLQRSGRCEIKRTREGVSKMVMKMRQLSPEQTPAYIPLSESGIIALAGWLRLGRINFFL
jgi:hypothetical protein